MNVIDELVALAKSEIGYLEKATNSNLDSKTGNAGDKNFTKYARDVGHANGYAWCQTFIAYLFMKIFGKTEANKLLCGKLSSASTMDVKSAFDKYGQLVPLSEAKAGDIMYRSRSGGGHVGLCVGRASNGDIITVEGNTSSTDKTAWNGGCVAQHTGGQWQWCARPKYAISSSSATSQKLGWIKVGTDWYYREKENANAHGWRIINKHKYYFDTKGKMLTDWQKIGNDWYYFQPNGDLEGALYVSDANGKQSIKEF